MAKATSLKDALKKWVKTQRKNLLNSFKEDDHPSLKAAESETIKLLMIIPPLQKLDATLATLTKCKQLSLSTNQIEKISNLTGLQSLEILSLGRNVIKKLEGLEPVADTLRELWISYNQIEKLSGIECLKNLKVLYMSNNKIKSWEEFDRLQALPALEDLLMYLNPLEEKHSAEGNWRPLVMEHLPKLKKLDGKPIVRDSDVQDEDAPAAAPAPAS